MTTLFFSVAVALYAASSLLFVGHLMMRRSERNLAGVSSVLFGIGLLMHAAGSGVRFARLGVLPATGSFESLGLLALAIGAVFFAVSRRYGVFVLGAFATPLCLVTAAASLAFSDASGAVPEALRSQWFPLHLSFAIGGEALFVTAGIAAVAYLVQSTLLQKKMLGPAFQKLPPLHLLDEIIYRVMGVGLGALSVGIVAGVLYAKQQWGTYWSWDPKQTAALMVWLVFAGILHARFVSGWQGRRTAWLTTFGVVLLLVLLIDPTLVLPGDLDTRHSGQYQ